MGDGKRTPITAELVIEIRQSATIEGTLRKSDQAKIPVMVKLSLNRSGYPPELQDTLVKTLLAQADLL